MNIPKKLIEKAIEGGWSPLYDGKPTIKWEWEMDCIWTYNPNEEVSFGEYQLHEINALKPLFWQALGKALGWPEDYNGDIIKLVNTHWEFVAHRFYDLILTGGDTDQFFKYLLK